MYFYAFQSLSLAEMYTVALCKIMWMSFVPWKVEVFIRGESGTADCEQSEWNTFETKVLVCLTRIIIVCNILTRLLYRKIKMISVLSFVLKRSRFDENPKIHPPFRESYVEYFPVSSRVMQSVDLWTQVKGF